MKKTEGNSALISSIERGDQLVRLKGDAVYRTQACKFHKF